VWWWKLLAVLTVVLHLAYLVFIPVGGFLAWRWRRIVPLHLAAILVGLVSITIHFDCPLTGWEQSFWRRAGERPYTNGFVDHYLAGKLFPHGYAWAVQVIFASCIAVAYVGLVLRLRREDARRSALAAPP
jgi:hypothetical protein